MISFFKKFAVCSALLLLISSCSQILETVELGTLSEKQLIQAEAQDDFDIQLKTLTFAEAAIAKNAPYNRSVMVHGSGEVANVYNEKYLLESKLPPKTIPKEYRLGIGDQLTFLHFQDVNLLQLQSLLDDATNDNLIKSQGRIGSDGNVLLLGLGLLDAADKTINELRTVVRNILIRKGLTPNFQLEITEFVSRKAFIFHADGSSGLIPITERPLSLKELAAQAGYFSKPNFVSVFTLKRDGKLYKGSSKDLLDENRSEVYIQDKDQIELDFYPYKPGQVYALSGSPVASIVPINPSKRESMADVMFLPGGPLTNQFAKRSEVYLLRGKSPVIAYHLDAQNVSRVLVAASMELRPSDIIYVAERPIVSFSRLLSEITPLRELLNDIKENNIP